MMASQHGTACVIKASETCLVAECEVNRPDVNSTAVVFADQVGIANKKIVAALTPPGRPGMRRWEGSDTYVADHLAVHAAACGLLDGLITDPGFLVISRPEAVLAGRGSLTTNEAKISATAFEMGLARWASLTEPQRIDLLAANAARVRASSLSAACRRASKTGWSPLWAAWSGRGHQELTGHTKGISTLSIEGGGRELIISGSMDATVRVWDAATGEPVTGPWLDHEGPVLAVAAGVVAAGN